MPCTVYARLAMLALRRVMGLAWRVGERGLTGRSVQKPNVVLISTYELGRQPFGLASPAAWLRRAGATVQCVDLSRQALSADYVRNAAFVAFYVPMHTAARLAVVVLPKILAINRGAHLCFYGLYAAVNEEYFRSLG